MSAIQYYHYRRKEQVNLDELISQLLDEEQRKMDIEEPIALAGQAGSTGSHRLLKCWHCGRPGHKEEDCWDKYLENRRGGSRRGSQGGSRGRSSSSKML